MLAKRGGGESQGTCYSDHWGENMELKYSSPDLDLKAYRGGNDYLRR